MLITSSANQKFKDLLKLHETKYRKKSKLFLVEGEHLVQEALKHHRCETIITKENFEYEFNFDSTITLSEKLFNQLSQTVSNNTVMAVCKIIDEEIEKSERILYLERIQDPGNMGTLIRSACAFGFDQIVCSADCVDIYNEKVIRSTQGALFQIPIQSKSLVETIRNLKERDFHIIGTGFENSVALASLDIKGPIMIMLGNEGQGLSEKALNLSDTIVSIEMHDFDSLNVSVAGGILMYHFRKG